MISAMAVLIVLCSVAYLAYPILRRDRSCAPDPLAESDLASELRAEKETLLRTLKELEFDVASGKLSPVDHAALRSRYEARAMAVMQELDAREAIRRGESPAGPPAETAPIRPVRTAAVLWSRPLFVASVVGCFILIIGGGGFLLGRITQQAPEDATARDSTQGGDAALATALESRLEQNPQDLDALIGLGRIYLQTGQMAKAIDVYKRALEVDRENVSALSGMAMILAQAGHSDQALGLFDRALAINPQMPMALLFKGRILFEDKRDFAGAIANWEQFLRVVPQGGPAEIVRGWIEEARRETRNMTEAGPSATTP